VPILRTNADAGDRVGWWSVVGGRWSAVGGRRSAVGSRRAGKRASRQVGEADRPRRSRRTAKVAEVAKGLTGLMTRAPASRCRGRPCDGSWRCDANDPPTTLKSRATRQSVNPHHTPPPKTRWDFRCPRPRRPIIIPPARSDREHYSGAPVSLLSSLRAQETA
jgi:hypothetical protein